MLFPIAFYDEITKSVDEESAMDATYLVFGKALDSLQNVLISKVGCYGLDCWSNGWVNN